MPTVNYHWFVRTLRMLALSLTFVSSSVAVAQETRSTILGTVTEATGAVVVGATVEITNTETNTTSKVTTNPKGYFEVPYLLPAVYSITVRAEGFKKHVKSGYVLMQRKK